MKRYNANTPFLNAKRAGLDHARIAGLKVVHNRIKSPGKFENQHVAILEVYDWFMNGDFGDAEFDLGDAQVYLYRLDSSTTLALRIEEIGFVSMVRHGSLNSAVKQLDAYLKLAA